METIRVRLTITGPDGHDHKFALDDMSGSDIAGKRLAAYLEWAQRPIDLSPVLGKTKLGEIYQGTTP